MKKRLLGVIALCCGLISCNNSNYTANYRVIPLPQEITEIEAEDFRINSKTVISHDGTQEMKRNAEFLAEYIKETTSMELSITDRPAENAITLATADYIGEEEGYNLAIDNTGIKITGKTPAGVFYGIQTLRKSIPVCKANEITMPAVQINDYPRFEYRGAHLDVSRHFFTTDSIKRFIDILAMHNINRFHWHLTDDQGWRIEIKKYPKLSTVAAQRDETVIGKNSGKYDGKHYGPFIYTQEECKDIIEYATERHITIIPEIDLPGHMQAALAAYPHLGCKGKDYTVGVKWGVQDEVMCVGRESTFEFIEDVMEEVLELFPSEYIHIGGDECRRKHWEECPACQARMRAEGFKREAELQTYCNHRIEALLKKHGRKMIRWDEVLDGGVSESTIVMSWTGVDGGIQAAKAGNDVIMTPHQYCYLNVPNSPDRDHEPPHGTRHPARRTSITLDKAYGYNPYEGLDEDQRKHIIGIQASLWTEHIRLFDHAMYMMNPRMGAISEIGWCNSGKDFQRYIKSQERLLDLYEHYGYNYAESYWRDN
jgi:hexosaminidase